MISTLTVDLKLCSSVTLSPCKWHLPAYFTSFWFAAGRCVRILPGSFPCTGGLQSLQPSSTQEFLLHKHILGKEVRSQWRMLHQKGSAKLFCISIQKMQCLHFAVCLFQSAGFFGEDTSPSLWRCKAILRKKKCIISFQCTSKWKGTWNLTCKRADLVAIVWILDTVHITKWKWYAFSQGSSQPGSAWRWRAGVRGFWLGEYFIGRRRNYLCCSAALGAAIWIPGGCPGALGNLHPGRSRLCCLECLPVPACVLGRLTELRARLHLTANFLCSKSRQYFFLCETDI